MQRGQSGVDEKAETSDSGPVLQFCLFLVILEKSIRIKLPRLMISFPIRHTKIYIYGIFQIFNGCLPPRANRWTKI